MNATYVIRLLIAIGLFMGAAPNLYAQTSSGQIVTDSGLI